MPHEHTSLYGERHNLTDFFLGGAKLISFRVFSQATISALFEGILIRQGSEVTSVLAFFILLLFYFLDIRHSQPCARVVGFGYRSVGVHGCIFGV
jgi:hypothetical protein